MDRSTDRITLEVANLISRGTLMRQHIESFNHLVQNELRSIVLAKSNYRVSSEVDPRWFAEYENCWVGQPSFMDGLTSRPLTPQQCRMADMSYCAPIYVNVIYFRETDIVRKKALRIGYLPVMLRSDICVLSGKSERQLAELGECPNDPGSYFILKGVERVLLMQEQGSNNRIVLDVDGDGQPQAVVTSNTAENKSRTIVTFKPTSNEGLLVKHTAFADPVPLLVLTRAMGMESDKEALALIGMSDSTRQAVSLSIRDCQALGVCNRVEAIDYLATLMRVRSPYGGTFGARSGDRSELSATELKHAEVMDVLQRQVLGNISSTREVNLAEKAICLCLMARRLLCTPGESIINDKDYYGNKRVELAGDLISVLFEDAFKTFNQDIRSRMDKLLVRHMQHRSSVAGSSKRMDPYPDAFGSVPESIISTAIQRAMSSGTWNIRRFRIERSGVSQVMNRMSFIATLGAVSRIKSQFEKSRKLTGPRSLQPSQWGIICPVDTPEGEQCGLVKHLALHAQVTTELVNKDLIAAVCFAHGVYPWALAPSAFDLVGSGSESSRASALVFHNGSLLGCHSNPEGFVTAVRNLRRSGVLSQYVSVYYHLSVNSVYISSDRGRLCRPLLIVDPTTQRPKLTVHHVRAIAEKRCSMDDLVKQGVVEWLDVNEENDAYIGFIAADGSVRLGHNLQHGSKGTAGASGDMHKNGSSAMSEPIPTHAEIEPYTILGVVGGLIPFPHHNQSPRNTYQCAMGKQAIGAVAHNQYARLDTVLPLLVYPQRPLVSTRTLSLVNWNDLPAGQNASVAVLSYSGYDIEDAVILNKASLDRGFGRCHLFKRTACSLENRAGLNERVCKVDPLAAERAASGAPQIVANRSHQGRRGYRGVGSGGLAKIDDDGLPAIASSLVDGDIQIHKMSPVIADPGSSVTAAVSATAWAPMPLRYKNPLPATVDRVLWSQDEASEVSVKVVLRQSRIPEVGDKFSSRHGQKGVVGLIVSQEDLPFSEQGWSPDIIMNPHGFPSRMTVGKMLELLTGKSCVLEGKIGDGTVFGGTSREYICETLTKHGFNPSGKDLLYDGMTGKAYECYIFSGPIYYQRLKHMVADKIHARSTGPRQALTRQPTEGRSRDGGLRLGEMERDCLIAHGVGNLIVERLVLSSDGYDMPVCRACGIIARSASMCEYCKDGSAVVHVSVPYACKLMFQELMSMCILPRLELRI